MPKASIINQICKATGVSYEWLISGRGEMYAHGAPHRLPSQRQDLTNSVANDCPRCTELEQELKQEREERREVSAENRQLHRENASLLRENGALREKLARLEAERGKRNDDKGEGLSLPGFFEEKRNTLSSSRVPPSAE